MSSSVSGKIKKSAPLLDAAAAADSASLLPAPSLLRRRPDARDARGPRGGRTASRSAVPGPPVDRARPPRFTRQASPAG